jgi:peroxiredoxin
VLQTVTEPQRTRPPRNGAELRDVVVYDQHGTAVQLGELWRFQPAVLVFLRHYGCVFCRAHAVELHRARDRFQTAGARLAAIGMGTPEQAVEFRRAQSIHLPVYSDPEARAYEAAGAKQATMSELFHPRVVARGLAHTIRSRLRQGAIAVHQGRIVDNPAQLGGVLVVAPDDSVRYAHMSEDASDVPPVEEVLAAVQAIRPHAPAARDGQPAALTPAASSAAARSR